MSRQKMKNIYKAFNEDLRILVEKERESFEYKVKIMQEEHVISIKALKDEFLEQYEIDRASYKVHLANELAVKDSEIASMQADIHAAKDAVMAVPEYQTMLDEQAGQIESLRREIDHLTTRVTDAKIELPSIESL